MISIYLIYYHFYGTEKYTIKNSTIELDIIKKRIEKTI